ncbi:unnamed protein product, partial [Mesorhabditis spiculigera]
MRLPLILAVVLCTALAALQTKMIYKESTMKRMIREDRWDEYKAVKAERRAKLLKRRPELASYPQNVLDYDDAEYIGHITIGTPDQDFLVILDTASATLWVPDRECGQEMDDCEECLKYGEDECNFKCDDPFCCDTIHRGSLYREPKKRFGACLHKHKFDPTKSTTFAPFPGDGWETGAAYGWLGMDTVRFGSVNETQLVIPKINFGQALDIDDGFYGDPSDGILGLGFTSLAVDHIIPPFISAVNQKLVDQPIFSVFLKTDGQVEGQPGGVFTWGGIDTDNCAPVQAWMPLQAADYWVFKLKGVAVGNLSSVHEWNAISDTSSALIGGPALVIGAIAKQVGAQYNLKYDMYIISCNATNGPDITMEIGQHNYTIPATNYIIPSGKANLCFMNFVNYNAQAFKPQWYIGNPLMRQYCHFYDVSKQRLGFAPPKTSAQTQTV